MPEKKEAVFNWGIAVDVSPYTFTKGNLSYLSWSHGLRIVKGKYPDAYIEECNFSTEQIKVVPIKETAEGKEYQNIIQKVDMPYFTDGKTCYVKTKLVIPSQAVSEECTLPILDHKNQCIPAEKVTMFDVNKSLRRCAAKNIAITTGVGLNLWFRSEISDEAKDQKIITNLEQNDAIEKFKALVSKGYDRSKLVTWLQTNFNTNNPRTIKSEEILARLSEELDKLDIKDFQPEKKTK